METVYWTQDATMFRILFFWKLFSLKLCRNGSYVVGFIFKAGFWFPVLFKFCDKMNWIAFSESHATSNFDWVRDFVLNTKLLIQGILETAGNVPCFVKCHAASNSMLTSSNSMMPTSIVRLGLVTRQENEAEGFPPKNSSEVLASH